jgi:hypothetical protein
MKANVVAGVAAGGAGVGFITQYFAKGVPYVGSGVGGFILGAVITGLGAFVIDMDGVGDFVEGFGVGYAVSSVL